MNTQVPCYRSRYTKAALFVLTLLLAGGAVGSHFGGLGMPGIVAFAGASGIVGLIALVLLIPCRKKALVRHNQAIEVSQERIEGIIPPPTRYEYKTPAEAYKEVEQKRPIAIWFLHKKYEEPYFEINKCFDTDKQLLKERGLLNSNGGLDEQIVDLIESERSKPSHLALESEFAIVEKLYNLRAENLSWYFTFKVDSSTRFENEKSERDDYLKTKGLIDSDGSVPQIVTEVFKKYFP